MQAPLQPSPISPTIDLDAAGVRHGHLQLPYSRDDSAYGAVMIPISVLRNGEGPTALLTGGNHGDEYQGPLALIKLARQLDDAELTGRVIIVPEMNQPAFAAATRTSPIDHVNLNRAFPGRPDGTVTEKIADYLTRELLPRADFVLDIHDGGKTLDFLPMASSLVLDDADAQAKGVAAAEAFGAPFVTQLVELDTIGMWDFVAGNSGRPFVTTELGGGGTTRPSTARIADHGVRNLLRHWGVLAGEPAPSESVRIHIPESGAYVTCETNGLIEWLIDLGDPIREGQVIALVHDPVRLGTAATEYRATIDGILAMRHYPGLVQMGDAIAMQAIDVS
jgi:N-alpha-acetyl-L-2,4-diaminobutyrate deacetylase